MAASGGSRYGEAIASHRPGWPTPGLKTAVRQTTDVSRIRYDSDLVQAGLRLIEEGEVV